MKSCKKSTILTGSWFTQLPATHIKIGISRGVPRGLPAGYRLFKKLAPGPWFNNVSVAEYDRRYKAEILAPLDPATVVAAILDIAGGKTPVLCCYERPDGKLWCHRAMAAEWLAAYLRRGVPEFGFEHLPQHEHPLMPAELRRTPPPEADDDVTPYLGRVAAIGRLRYTVLRADPGNPGQAIVSDGTAEFSTSLRSLARYFRKR
jgi:hypothetical protein